MRLHISNVGHIVPAKSRVTRWGRRTAYDLPRIQTGERAGKLVLDWGANSKFDGPSVRFTTDPSGVVRGTLPSSNYELSLNWLNWHRE
jgi:hypothetical protein